MGRASLLAVPPNFGPAHAAGNAEIEIKKPSSPRDERTRDTTQIAIPAIFRCCNGRSRKIPHFLLQSGKIKSSRQLPPAAASLNGFPIPSSSSRLLGLVYAGLEFLSRGKFCFMRRDWQKCVISLCTWVSVHAAGIYFFVLCALRSSAMMRGSDSPFYLQFPFYPATMGFTARKKRSTRRKASRGGCEPGGAWKAFRSYSPYME